MSLDKSTGARITSQLGQTIAAWQTPEGGQGQPGVQRSPKRVVIRCDGNILDSLGDTAGTPGFPAAVLEVRYTIGGLTRRVLVDTIMQSALTVWADSVDVGPVWDDRRIARMGTTGLKPCFSQDLAAAINTDAQDGDTGTADARWLDALAVDATGTGGGEVPANFELSIHPIPEGARGLRFLDALDATGKMVSIPGLTTIIAWQVSTWDPNNPFSGVVQFNTNGATDTSILIAPANARFLLLFFPAGTIASFFQTSWIEWIMAPATLYGF